MTACHHHSQQTKKRSQDGNVNAYICPMHPEIRQSTPGACPICGMDLEPETADVETGNSAEYKQMRFRFIVSLILTLPVFVLAMGEHMLSLVDNSLLSGWIQAILATVVILYGGQTFYQRAWLSLKSGNLNMFTLIVLGTSIAWVYSFIALLFPGWFPQQYQDSQGMVALYFEAAAVIITLVLLGQVMELKARQKTGDAIRALMQLNPDTAHRVDENNEETDIPIDDVNEKDTLRVKSGERVPVDGEVTTGSTHIDESMITGEPMPVNKQPGDNVIGGTLNTSGSFMMQAQQVGSETTLSKIIQQVTQAQRSQAPLQRIADKVAAWFVPAVVIIAIVAFIVWYWLGPSPALAYALLAMVSVLIIACPCALGLATPMSIMVGIGQCAKRGILIKDAKALEAFAAIDTIVFDKTGTLTQGKPSLTAIEPCQDNTQDDILSKAASLEQGSEHPLAVAILQAAKTQNLPLKEVDQFEAEAGRGVQGQIDGQTYYLGNAKWLQSMDIDLANLSSKETGSHLFLARENQAIGLFIIQDPVKSTAKQMIDYFHQHSIQCVMLTGDNQNNAEHIAEKVGIDQVIAEVLPDDKAKQIKTLQKQASKVAMVGDGVNDAIALSTAHIGIAMGSGSDVAIESADVTLLSGDIGKLVTAHHLSQLTVDNIHRNLIFAFVYNGLGIPLAAGVLYPIWGYLLNPMFAALAMSLSSVSVITNALTLRWQKPETLD